MDSCRLRIRPVHGSEREKFGRLEILVNGQQRGGREVLAKIFVEVED